MIGAQSRMPMGAKQCPAAGGSPDAECACAEDARWDRPRQAAATLPASHFCRVGNGTDFFIGWVGN